MARFTQAGGEGSGAPGPQGPQGPQGEPGQDAVLPQGLDTTDSPYFDKIYITHNSDGTNVKIGDDAWIGDIDTANHISVQGVQDATQGGVVFGSNETELISSDGTNLSLTANNDIVLNPGSTYAYIGTPQLDGSNRIAKMSDITGGVDSHGDFYFDATTLRVDSSDDMILEANEGDSTVAAQIKIGNGDIPIEIASYERDDTSFYEGDWSTAEWQSDGNGGGQIVLTGITGIADFLNNGFNGEFQKITINNDFMYPYTGGSYGGGNATLYVTAGPEGGTPVIVTTLTFTWSDKSGITIDYDDSEMNIIASNMELNIETTSNEDININASDDLRLESGDDMFLRSNGYINFVSSNNDSNYEWRMESNGTLEFPARGRLRNPSSSSGDGNGYDTFHIIPDFSRYEYDQYLIVDPTTPNHIHIRAGGEQDNSSADLILGSERTKVAVSESYGQVAITTKIPDETNSYQNIESEPGINMIVNGAIYPDYVIVDGTKHSLNGHPENGYTIIEGQTIITVPSVTFLPGELYIFGNIIGDNSWSFSNDGYLSGPGMGTLNVYGIANPSSDYPLYVNSNESIILNGTNGEFLNDASVPNNQIATIGDVTTAVGVGGNGEVTRWSPNFQATGLVFTGTDNTYPTYNSHYVKNGRMVSFWIAIDLNTVTNFGTGQYIAELPFMPLTGTMNHFQAWANVDPTVNPDVAGHVVLQADHLANTKNLDLHYLKQAGGAHTPIVEGIFKQGEPATLTTASKIYINGTYITAE